MPRPVDLKTLQVNLPWTIRYSGDFRASPMTHKDFAHTMHHVSKAAGQLHALCDDMDHDREVADDPTLKDRYAKYIADLVVCALRLANTFPGTHIDLQQAVIDRIETKNGVKLGAEYTEPETLTAEEKEFIGETIKGSAKATQTLAPEQEAIPLAILERYHEMIGPVIPQEQPNPGTEACHLAWMLGEMEGMRGPRQHRWLGFIQGILILRGRTTVKEERDFTRKFFKAGEKHG